MGSSNNWYKSLVIMGFVPVAGGALVVVGSVTAWLRCGEVVGLCLGLCMASNGVSTAVDRVSILPSVRSPACGARCDVLDGVWRRRRRSLAYGAGEEEARRVAPTENELGVWR
jgi:hypothetical protein